AALVWRESGSSSRRLRCGPGHRKPNADSARFRQIGVDSHELPVQNQGAGRIAQWESTCLTSPDEILNPSVNR
ncbi:MAG: hypothetical protein V3T60_14580, partial [Candidatus Binatia bacterium]